MLGEDVLTCHVCGIQTCSKASCYVVGHYSESYYIMCFVMIVCLHNINLMSTLATLTHNEVVDGTSVIHTTIS